MIKTKTKKATATKKAPIRYRYYQGTTGHGMMDLVFKIDILEYKVFLFWYKGERKGKLEFANDITPASVMFSSQFYEVTPENYNPMIKY